MPEPFCAKNGEDIIASEAARLLISYPIRSEDLLAFRGASIAKGDPIGGPVRRSFARRSRCPSVIFHKFDIQRKRRRRRERATATSDEMVPSC